LRILLLLLLLLAIINPIIKGTTATSSDALEDRPTSTPLLQFPQESVGPPRGEGLTVRTGSGNYGTFESAIYSATRLAPSPEALDHATGEIQPTPSEKVPLVTHPFIAAVASSAPALFYIPPPKPHLAK